MKQTIPHRNPSRNLTPRAALTARIALAAEDTIDIAVESTGTVRANEAIEITSQRRRW